MLTPTTRYIKSDQSHWEQGISSMSPPPPPLPSGFPPGERAPASLFWGIHKISAHGRVPAALSLAPHLRPICPWRTAALENFQRYNWDATDSQVAFEDTICMKCGLLVFVFFLFFLWKQKRVFEMRLKTGQEVKTFDGVTLRDAWMSKKGLFRTLNGSLALSIWPVFIFSIRGEMISFSMHNSRMLKSHWPTGCPWKTKRNQLSLDAPWRCDSFKHSCEVFQCRLHAYNYPQLSAVSPRHPV